MVEDLNFHKVKKLFFVIIFFIFFFTNLFAQNLKFEKLVVLNDPWGSSFLNNKELIITEKSGKIKIIDILQKKAVEVDHNLNFCLLYTSPSPRDNTLSRMPSSA